MCCSRDAVSRTAHVWTWLRKRNGGHKWVNGPPRSPLVAVVLEPILQRSYLGSLCLFRGSFISCSRLLHVCFHGMFQLNLKLSSLFKKNFIVQKTLNTYDANIRFFPSPSLSGPQCWVLFFVWFPLYLAWSYTYNILAYIVVLRGILCFIAPRWKKHQILTSIVWCGIFYVWYSCVWNFFRYFSRKPLFSCLHFVVFTFHVSDFRCYRCGVNETSYVSSSFNAPFSAVPVFNREDYKWRKVPVLKP